MSGGDRFLRPGAQLGLRDPEFAAAMRRAEGAASPKEDPDDPVARTQLGYAIRRDGSKFMPGPAFDLERLPLID